MVMKASGIIIFASQILWQVYAFIGRADKTIDVLITGFAVNDNTIFHPSHF